MQSIEFNTFLLLGDSEGNEIARNNDIDAEAYNYHSFVLVMLPADGTYQIWANGLDETSSGSYRLTVVETTLEQMAPILTTGALAQVEANRLLEQGLQQLYVSQSREALQSVGQALAIYREIGDRQGEAKSLGNIGLAYAELGEYEHAIDLHQQAFEIAQQINDREWEAGSLSNLGNAYLSLGEYGYALSLLQQALKIDNENNDSQGEANSLGSIGTAYFLLGQYDKAVEFHQQELAIALEIGHPWQEGAALNSLGLSYFGLGNYDKAIDFYQKSLVIAQEMGAPQEEAASLGNLGLVYMILGENNRSINFLRQQLKIENGTNNRLGEANSLGNLGAVYANLGEYEHSFELLQQQLLISHEINSPLGVANSLNSQGVTYIGMARLSDAESVLSESIETYDSLRTGLSDGQLIAIADTQKKAYQNLERALVAQDKIGEALTITERGRARAFVLQLASRFSDAASQADVPPPSITDIQQIARGTNSTLVTYSQNFDQALYIWVVQPSGEIAFRSVEFDGASDSGLTINPITAIDGPVYRGATDESALSQLVADSRANFVVESSDTNPQQLKDLHKVLIDPIVDLLPTDPNAKVVFVPQGNLFLVPFAALQDDDGTYLIEKHTILTAPSIQVFGLANEATLRLRSAGGGRSLGPRSGNGIANALVVGNPTMPTVWSPTASGDYTESQLPALAYAGAEAEAIGNFLNVTPLLGNQATEARIKQQLPTAQLIHLATHGLLDYGDPRAYGTLDVPGAVALAPGNSEDGLLTSAEILEMDLQAELAVLSACDTGRGKITGDGVVGLSRSLITAGVPSVVVSLWSVPDDATAELMTEFYRQLDQGQDKAQALRQAMLITMKHASHAAPMGSIYSYGCSRLMGGTQHLRNSGRQRSTEQRNRTFGPELPNSNRANSLIFISCYVS
ncbi:MAG: CHAT domain-containing tetratricopeptide repeat protein [Nodosilinea sp.]